MAWCVSTVKQICLKSSFESVKADEIANSSRDVVPDSRSQDCEGMTMRPMQDGRSARAQYPRRLMTVQFTRQIIRDTIAVL